MEIKTRKFKKNDFFRLTTIAADEWQQVHANISHSMLNKNDKVSQCRIAVLDGKIVGYIYGFSLPNGTLIPEFLYVCADYRHQGIGKMLLDDFEKNSGCCSSMIFYHKSLRTYYERQGYQCGNNLEVAMKDLPSSEDGAT